MIPESKTNSCKHEPSSNQESNGLITKVWGNPGWIFGHAITFGFPVNPTPEQQQHYLEYFRALGNVLPCKICRESYQKYISTGDTALTEAVVKNRESLTRWFYQIHEAVNKKLGMNYEMTYEDVVKKYESFRARCPTSNASESGCVAPLDYKAFSFKNLYEFDAPVIKLNDAIQFMRLAKIRGLSDEYLSFIRLAIQVNGDVRKLKTLESWHHRNQYCQKQIKYMRENAIPSIEINGNYYGLPTIDELKLIMFLSSNLNRTEIDKVISVLKSHNLN